MPPPSSPQAQAERGGHHRNQISGLLRVCTLRTIPVRMHAFRYENGDPATRPDRDIAEPATPAVVVQGVVF
jgi:hypothetical protein